MSTCTGVTTGGLHLHRPLHSGPVRRPHAVAEVVVEQREDKARAGRQLARDPGGLYINEGTLSFVTVVCFSIGILHTNENGEA